MEPASMRWNTTFSICSYEGERREAAWAGGVLTTWICMLEWQGPANRARRRTWVSVALAVVWFTSEREVRKML